MIANRNLDLPKGMNKTRKGNYVGKYMIRSQYRGNSFSFKKSL